MKTPHFKLTPPSTHPDPKFLFPLTAILSSMNFENKQIMHEDDLDIYIHELQELKIQLTKKENSGEKISPLKRLSSVYLFCT